MMNTVDKIWMDGVMMPWADAKVHVLAHALHYGSAVFEGIRFYKTATSPAVFRLDEHIDRLYYSAEVIKMKIPFSKEEMKEAVVKTIQENKISAGYIRPLAMYGYGKMGLNPEGADINCFVAIWPWGSYLDKELVNVKVSKYIRLHPQSVVTDAKVCGHYVNSILASQEIRDSGYDEALLLDYKGDVAEGPGENLFMVKDGVIYTVPAGTILKGITRDCVFALAKDNDFKIEEKKLSLDELKNADELFFTGTAAEIQPIGKLDETEINHGEVGPITKVIQESYNDLVHGRNEKYTAWLTYT